ncbi:probable inactive histone-lysine N-methyltransferase SUVR2 [Phragmites australis]|uniref:probable inactive histone-lysine N-methyltransferase SUVR2 n=1 Tax=Phragmites australis TaxID=29695 RepID=UPI002D791735|nr:probable inactive histone-lysine N-methyltransferase SUVR2 [Phragmites australis]
MAPPRVSMAKFDDAVKSMTNIGIPKETVVRVLDKLLSLYDDNWEHIEADNYSALVDAIFDDPDPMEGQKKRTEKKNLDSDHCSKKFKIKERDQKPKSNVHGNEKRESAEVPRQQEAKALEGKAIGTKLRKPSSQKFSKEPKMETSLAEVTTIGEISYALLLESQDNRDFETPLAVMCPQVLEPSRHRGHEDAHMTSGVQHAADQKFKGVSVAHEEHMADERSSQAVIRSKDFSTVALSNCGNGKLSFSFNSSLANRSDFHMPDIESIRKAMEARCLSTYKILDPNFSFMKLLDDTCQCILDLSSGSSEPRERSIVQVLPAMDILSKPLVQQSFQSNQASSSCMPLNNLTRLGGSASAGVSQNNSSNMQVQHQLPTSVKQQYHDVNDITKGEERVSIPIVNGIEDGVLPPPFHYIPHNITSQDAYINLSLARIGDENCCSECLGDCLAEPLPCACATETGGEFAYTRDGLLTKGFLDACVLREPHKHPHFYCKICPNERIKAELNYDSPDARANPGPCKGHRIRKFIKECWRKCGCTRYCGNRVVQRGIIRNLQVFLTSRKKGWGLRTAEKLPPGAFVCEYVGEILTNTELYERTIQKTGNAKHTYPVLLDADWGTESVLKDEEALCLDATFYGNVARFINHRCFDANIIDIPVEIETPDHHYFHLAFFTKRQIEPFEELTWDYGIDFDDVNHPVKAFKCYCGSEFCRDKRRLKSKARALVLS